jgi:hypothetical protein
VGEGATNAEQANRTDGCGDGKTDDETFEEGEHGEIE